MHTTFTEQANDIFNKTIDDYHLTDNVDEPIRNPYERGTIEFDLYLKNWIDTVQWHLEDIIRDPAIDPVAALALKRRIDRSNQERTDLAWAVDRLSILALKIYHMQEQVRRTDATDEHKAKCQAKLDILLQQRADLSLAIDQLLDDFANGRKYMKVYKQMKMYNDPSTNPILYGKK